MLVPTPAVLAYLRLRARVVGRQLRELGWWRLALLGGLLLAFGGNILGQAARHPRGQWAVPLVLFSLVWSAHRRRPDLVFLRAAGPGFRYGLAAEYALLVLPVAGALLALGAGAGAGLLTLALPPLAALAGPARERTPRQRRPRSLFRSEAFEWVSGMRGVGGGLLWLALLAGALWQHATPLGAGLALAGWLLVVLACYGTPEPATMLVLAARRPGPFLGRRLGLGLTYAALTAAPFGWLLATSGAGSGGAAAMGLLLVLTSLLILIKYAFYPNAFLIWFSQAIVICFVLSQPSNPVYPPLLAALLGGLLWQSRRRLGQFRYDEQLLFK